MNIITSFWKESAVYGFGSFIVRIISFLLLPLYTNFFNQSEVGYIYLIFAFIAFAQIFYNHGLDSSFLKYYTKNSHDKDIVGTTLITSLYLTSFCMSIIIILASYFINNLFGLLLVFLFF